MIRRIAFIHTVAMLVERFRPRFQLAPRVDRIVLAQASLAHLAEPLADQLGLPMFASLELLVQEVVARVRDSA